MKTESQNRMSFQQLNSTELGADPRLHQTQGTLIKPGEVQSVGARGCGPRARDRIDRDAHLR